MLICGAAAYGVRKGVERFLPSEPTITERGAPADPDVSRKPEGDKKEKEDKKRADKPQGSGMKALLRAMPKLVLPGLAALILFYPACKLLRLRELDEIIAFAREKVRRKKGGGPPPSTGAP